MPSFLQLHYSDTPLVLPNAWDLGSGLAFAAAGYAAIGTTSFGVAASAGMPDGAGASQAASVTLAAQLCRLPAHITIDIEDGFSANPLNVAELVAALAEVGVAGVNLEDSVDGHLVDPAIVAAKIAAIKERTPDVFVNARVDNFWFQQDATVEAVVARAQSYAAAGADGIFTPGVLAAEHIRGIADAVVLPLNLLAHPQLTVPELAALGVRRISSGSLPYRASVDAAVQSVNALRDGTLPAAATSYWQMQSRLEAFNAEADNHNHTADSTHT